MRAFYIPFFAGLLLSVSTFSQYSTWERGVLEDPASPYRNLKTDSKGAVWELLPYRLFRYREHDTTQFQLPFGNAWGANFHITSTGLVHVKSMDRSFVIKNDSIIPVQTALDYAYDDRIFRQVGDSLYSITLDGKRKRYPVRFEYPQGGGVAFYSDDSSFLCLAERNAQSRFVLHEYRPNTDEWVRLGGYDWTKGEVVALHPATHSLVFYGNDTLYAYQAEKGLRAISLKHSTLGSFLSLKVISDRKELMLFYRKGIRTYDGNFKDYPFSGLLGLDTLPLYTATAEQVVYEKEKKVKTSSLIQLKTYQGFDSLRFYSLRYGNEGFQFLHRLTYKKLSDRNQEFASVLRDTTLINYVYIPNTYTLSIFINASKKLDLAIPSSYSEVPACSESHLWIRNSGPEYYYQKVAHDLCYITGSVYFDKNRDGQFNWDERGMPYCKLKMMPSGLVVFTNGNGQFDFNGQVSGAYQMSLVGKYQEYFENPPPFTILRNSGISLGLKQKKALPMEASVTTAMQRSRCNEVTTGLLSFYNTGIVDIDSARIELSVESPVQLGYNQEGPFAPTISFSVPAFKSGMGNTYHFAVLWPSGEHIENLFSVRSRTRVYVKDTLKAILIDSSSKQLFCSYDPNDKAAMPFGVSDKHYTLKKSALEYTIRFENTGNDYAYNIQIKDTLSKELDGSCFEVVAASHPVNTELSNSGVATFLFKNINLPDTSTDKQKAQGFVRYRIKAKEDIAEGKDIFNTASIYFDKNPPIVTNTTFNRMVTTLPLTTDWALPPSLEETARFFPIPATGVLHVQTSSAFAQMRLLDIQGRLIASSQESSLIVGHLTKGMYIVQLLDEHMGLLAVKKITIE